MRQEENWQKMMLWKPRAERSLLLNGPGGASHMGIEKKTLDLMTLTLVIKCMQESGGLGGG